MESGKGKTLKKHSKSKWKPDEVTYPGEKVQIDIKYVPRNCIAFNSYGVRYYQITVLDKFSRTRYYEIVDEKSVTHTGRFILELEKNLAFKIDNVQTNNGKEFTNDPDITHKKRSSRKTLKN